MSREIEKFRNVNVRGRLSFGDHCAGILAGAGDSNNYHTTVEKKNFLEFRLKNVAPAGDVRGLYLRHKIGGAAASGEAARIYTEAVGALAQMHGAHITGQVSSGGSVTGQAVGGRVTLATASGLTLSGGGYHVLRLDTDLNSALSGVTKSSLIYMAELQTNKVANLFCTEGTVGPFAANTHAIDSHALAYIATCNINGTPCYLPFFAAVPA